MAHSTLISAGEPAPACPAVEVSTVQSLPPSEVRYSSPSAPSQPCRGSPKQTVCASAGVASRRQVRPPSLVLSTTPPRTGVSGPAPPTLRPPATANPVAGEMKCTERITGHGSGSAVQRAPPSVVASRDVMPTAQPSCPLMKSTEVRLSLPDSCAVQCVPPSAVARIAFWLTAHPCDADANCRPSMPGGYEGACAPGQERGRRGGGHWTPAGLAGPAAPARLAPRWQAAAPRGRPPSRSRRPGRPDPPWRG